MHPTWPVQAFRRRTWIVAVTVPMLVGASMPMAASAAAPTGSVVSGLVTRDGAPTRGASVVIEVLPSLDNAAGAPAGMIVEYTDVGNAQTDERGRFMLVPANIPGASIDRAGFANFRATVSNGQKSLQWFFPLLVRNAGGIQSTRAATVDLVFELGANPGVADTANPPSSWSGMSKDDITSAGLLAVDARPVGASASKGSADVTPNFVCTTTWTNNYQNGVTEAFANAWAWSGGKATFHESQTTSHTLGIAYQSPSGTWSQSGNASFSETETNFGDSANLVDRQINNRVNYRQQIGSCGGKWWLPVSTFALQSPILYYSPSAHPIWSACATYVNGQTPGKSSGTNTTFGGGVGLVGIHVSAQAGWSSEISIKWTFTANSWLCGSTAAGPGGSPQAEAHQR